VTVESNIQRAAQLALSAIGVIMWRNNVGKMWAGKLVSFKNGRVILDNARPVTAGLCNGSSDLIGLKSVTITPDMVGRKIAVFVALEAKTPTGRTQTDQYNFMRVVNESGGIAGIFRSPDDAVNIVLQNTTR
jgi:hypothetical protein